jgi:hypothetical protein
MPNEEAFEYLATQAVADYLATEVKLDGIIFPSVQVGHVSPNVVLFHHSSRVKEVEVPKGTTFYVRLEQQDSDGISPDYSVWEQVPNSPQPTESTEQSPLTLSTIPMLEELVDDRPFSLEIDLGSVAIHHIKAVSFEAKSYPVIRDRWTIKDFSK